jgi:hypothetical protein
LDGCLFTITLAFTMANVQTIEVDAVLFDMDG